LELKIFEIGLELKDFYNNQLLQWNATEERITIYPRYGESAHSSTILSKKKR